jgi:hypothetical protein
MELTDPVSEIGGYDRTNTVLTYMAACSFRWIIVTESTVRWFIVREKHCWMVTDLAEPAKRTG